MIPNNNLSVLPFYGSLAEQNARRWWIYDKIYPLFTPATYMLPFQILREERVGATFTFEIYTSEGVLVDDYSAEIVTAGITVVTTGMGYDVIVFNGSVPVFPSMGNGQYYAVLGDGTDTWYSEMFTVVNDITGYLKLEWWNKEDFYMDAGAIIYENPSFRNVLYVQADIAKPEYIFEDEVEERGGYTFPIQKISKKRYHFNFLASEYLLDAIRFAHISDFVQVTKDGKTYTLDTFLITPEWEENGDVAVVTAEFDTANVARITGTGYIRTLKGDFNDDFNDDFYL